MIIVHGFPVYMVTNSCYRDAKELEFLSTILKAMVNCKTS